MADAVVGGGKATAGHRGQSVVDRFVGVHWREANQEDNLKQGQDEVHDPKRLSGLGQFWSQSRQRGPGQFCPGQGHASSEDPREHHHAEHDDAHASQPLHGGAPEQEAPGLSADAILRGGETIRRG